MKISLNWLKKYVDINVDNAALEKLIDSRLVEIEEIIDESKKYDNIFVVKVVECEAIPDTHLHLCQIDAGTNELIQIVCGAPNVHAGMLAAWIAPGAIVPQSVHEDAPFVIGKRKMLGKYDSCGMLAGADELDFTTDHSTIVEIDPEIAQPGDRLADIFELNDVVLDIENKSLTHRPDCFGVIGFAREVAGVLGQKFVSEPAVETADYKKINADIADKTICPRYSAVVLKKHGEIKKKYLSLSDTLLAKAGMRPVDPIVDATNYLMLLTGQPLHAFDYDKFLAVGGTTEPKVGVRLAKKGEKLVLLDDTEVELIETDIVITSNDVPVALAGAMGGKSTMIDENTKNVIIESATFSLFNLRKTQMAHGIFSEAITRFTKGQPAYQTLSVALKCAEMLKDGFEISEIIDSGYTTEENVVKITTDEINGLLGTNYSLKQIVTTLENVEFKVEVNGNNLTVAAPVWRTDIHIKEDIIEEVGRLNGYDNIAPVLPAHATAEKNKMVVTKSQIRNFLSLTGANEVLTYTFVHGDLLEKVGQDVKNSYRLINSISPDLQYLRQQIVPSLLVKAYDNLKAKHNSFALFEMNQTFSRSTGVDEDNVPIANNNLAMVVVDNTEETKYYLAKKYIEELGKKLGINLTFKKFVPVPKEAFYEPKRSASIYIGDKIVGCIGEMKYSVLNKFKLPRGVAAFEISLEALTEFATLKKSAPEISDYPTVSRDITITTDKPYEEIFEKLQAKLAAKDLVFKIVPTSIYQADGNAPSLSFHLDFADKNKTLESAEILDIMSDLEKVA
ncbi:phenylalanine--tRNA ligase subunit beta [Candidatus Saccharibacteria bacterium]|nr:phenylalanine--tRNA ligase subunit beta [Candidatus Saccharibacteria bacterium]